MYEYFRPFVNQPKPPNRFWVLDEAQIMAAELRLGYAFPSELRRFYEEIGCGFFSQGVRDQRRDRSVVNGILSPDEAADLLLDRDCPIRPREGFVEGVLTFFDLGESSYLVLRPKDPSPNIVYWPDGKSVVAESVRLFFEQLYQEAAFYRGNRN